MTNPSKLAADVKSKCVNVRSLAQVIGEPQRAEPFAAETQSPEQGPDKARINLPTTTETDPATQDANSFPTWQTRVKIFLLSTGGDSGSSAEIRVTVGIEGFPIAEASTGLPLHSSWANENGGLGHELAHQVRTVVGAVPLSFGGYVDENDTIGSNEILFYTVDFTNPEWIQYADGSAWRASERNSNDAGYVATIWWQVTRL